jgi:hypothetical protein
MRALCALCMLLLIAATTAAADTTPAPVATPAPEATTTPAPEAEVTAAPEAEIAAADAEQAIATAEAELAAAEAELAAAEAPLAAADMAQLEAELAAAQQALSAVDMDQLQAEIAAATANIPQVDAAEIEKAIAAAHAAGANVSTMNWEALAPQIQAACKLATKQGLTSLYGAEDALVAAKGQLEGLSKALEELQASGELSAAGADKLKALLKELADTPYAKVYSLKAPLAQAIPGFPDGSPFYAPQGPMAEKWMQKFNGPEFQQQLFEKHKLFDQLDLHGMYMDADKLKELHGMHLKKIEDLTPEQREKVEQKLKMLQDKGTSGFSSELFGGDANVYAMPKEHFGKYKELFGKHGQLWQNGDTGMHLYRWSDGSKALILQLNDDGTWDVKGPGYSEEELAKIRGLLQSNTALADILKQHAAPAPEAVEPNV